MAEMENDEKLIQHVWLQKLERDYLLPSPGAEPASAPVTPVERAKRNPGHPQPVENWPSGEGHDDLS